MGSGKTSTLLKGRLRTLKRILNQEKREVRKCERLCQAISQVLTQLEETRGVRRELAKRVRV